MKFSEKKHVNQKKWCFHILILRSPRYLIIDFIFLTRSLTYMSTTNLNRLKVVLVEQNKTGKWLAEQLGKSTCSVSKWCQNTVQPDLQTLDKISRLLDVDIKDLLVSNKTTNN
jgi:DNA-binding Xre family transcriptional regulator